VHVVERSIVRGKIPVLEVVFDITVGGDPHGGRLSINSGVTYRAHEVGRKPQSRLVGEVRAREGVDALKSVCSEYEDVGATLDGRVTGIVNSGFRFGRIIIVSPGGEHRVVVEPGNVHSEASGKERVRTYVTHVAFLPVHGAVDAGEAHFGNGKHGRVGSAWHEVRDVGGTTGVTKVEIYNTDGGGYVVEEPNFFEVWSSSKKIELLFSP